MRDTPALASRSRTLPLRLPLRVHEPSWEDLRRFQASQALQGFNYTTLGASVDRPPEGWPVATIHTEVGKRGSAVRSHAASD